MRPAGVEDRSRVQWIGRQSYQDHFAHCWSPRGLEAYLDADFSPELLRKTLADSGGHLWLLAERDRQVVGFAKLNWGVPEPISGQEGAEMQKIYFLKSETGKGYGTVLLEAVLGRVRESTFERIWLDVLKNNPGAVKFYQNQGFQIVGEKPFRTDLEEIGMVVMVRELN